MAVVGEASVKITGDLKPLVDALAKAKSTVAQFDNSLKQTSSTATKLFSKLQNQRVKIDYSAVTKMNQSFDAAQRRIEKINATKIRPQVDAPSLSFFNNLPDQVNRARSAVSAFDSTFNKVFATVGAYLGTKELINYADTWTRLGNEIAAASQVAGRQARSLEQLNDLANQSRSGISETVNLYARILRSTKDVAKSEEEVARATDTVNKAFKAGGAAASEQAAGILQLGQALGSGFLQGDELRSLRENAPLVAQAIANEFGVTIAKLKDLGAEGKLTTDRVFRGILNAEQNINAIFNTTTATIGESITRVSNALTQYIGQADKAQGASAVITSALTKLANNIDTAADVAFKFAAVLAGVFIGRQIGTAINNIGLMGSQLLTFTRSLRVASATAGSSSIAFGALGAALGPLTAIIGGLASVALYSYISSAANAEAQTATLQAEMVKLGIVSLKTAEEIDKASKATDNLSDASRRRKIQQIRDEIDNVREGWALLGNENNFAAVIDQARNSAITFWASVNDKQGAAGIEKVLNDFKNFEISAATAKIRLEEIRNTDITKPVADAADRAEELVEQVNNLNTYLISLGEVPGLLEINSQFESLRNSVQGFQDQGFLSQEQADSLDTAIKKIIETGEVTEETRKTIESLSGISPNLGGFFQSLDTLVGKLNLAIARSRELKAVNVDGVDNGQLGPDAAPFYKDRDAKAYVEEQKKSAALNDRDYKLSKLREQVRKEAKKDEKDLTEEQINQIALARLQGDIDRQNERKAERESKKKPKEKKEKLDDYQKEVRSTQERIALLQAEQEILQQFNPVVNDYGLALAKAETAQKLLSDAKRANMEVSKEELTLQELLAGDFDRLSPKARKQAEDIYFLADSYGAAVANQNQLKEGNKELEEQWNTIREASRSAGAGIVSDLVKGKSAVEALQNALGKLADAFLKIGLDILFGASGSGGFGAIGKIFGFADGGYTGDGGKYEPKGVVHGGEYVMSKQATKNIGLGNLEALHRMGKRGYASGGYVPSGVAVNNSSLSRRAGSIGGGSQRVGVDVGVRNYVDEDGNWRAAVQEISYSVSRDVTQQGMAEYNSLLPDRMQEIQMNPRRRSRV